MNEDQQAEFLSGVQSSGGGGIKRRDFMKGALAGTGLVVIAAACGSAASPGSSSAAGNKNARNKAPVRGGTLRMGLTGGGSTDTANPLVATTFPAYAWAFNVFDQLTTVDADGNLQLLLAAEMTPNANATEWTIRLRSGVTFHDGKPLTADDVIYTFQQIVNPSNAAAGVNAFNNVDIANITKLDALTLSVPCAKPYSSFDAALSLGEISIIPTNFDVNNPTGTGPFKSVSFDGGVQFTMARNDSYWQSGLPYLDSVKFTDFADETSEVNALVSGQLDATSYLSLGSLKTVQDAGLNSLVSKSSGFNNFTMRCDQAPFNDRRVRQAFALMIDREQMREQVFGGYGIIANDLYSIGDKENYDSSIRQRTQDIDQAKFLLKKAGAEHLSVELMTGDLGPGVLLSAQVLAQQAKAAGVNIKVNQLSTADFYGPGFLTYPFAMDTWQYFPFFAQAPLQTLSTAPVNESHYHNPQVDQLFLEAEATTNLSKRADIAHEMQKIIFEDTPQLIPNFYPVIDAFSTKVRGDVNSSSGLPFNTFDLKHISFAS